MPLDYARRLTAPERSRQGNVHLGAGLAFVAGATNAGAFLAVGQYTSHMTGLVSEMADAVVLRRWPVAATALGGVLAFIAGAASTAILVNFAQRRRLRSAFAQPLLLESALLLAFGFLGARLSQVHGFYTSVTVLLLCYMMGLQNAVITKISRAEIRTTHVTGLITDLGIELGKLVYFNRTRADAIAPVAADRERLAVLAALLLAFFAGGLVGALGFTNIGYLTTVPLSGVLLLLAVIPALDDLRGAARGPHPPGTV